MTSYREDVAARIDDDNIGTAPSDHFVKAEILEMTAIRQIDVGLPAVDPAYQLADEQGHRVSLLFDRIVGL